MSSDQVAQGFIHWGLENLQGRRWYIFSGQSVPLLKCETVLPHIQFEALFFQVLPVVSYTPTVLRHEEPVSLFSITTPQV